MKNLTEDLGRIVIVGGGGHVGLPLGLALSDCGYSVIAFDTSVKTVQQINLGVLPFLEEGAAVLLESGLTSNTFKASTDPSCIVDAEIIIVVIGTPVDEYLSPDPTSVVNVVKELCRYMNETQLLILRSTIFPGVYEQVERLISKEVPGLQLAYCPERIVEGQAIKELSTLPQIIGVRSDSAFNRAAEIFNALSGKTIRTAPEEAELAKLFSNVWRYLKFAVANQFWLLSNEAGLDFSRIRDAITFEYPRALDLPNAGFSAGPCLFKDTMQLAAFSNNNFGLGHSAMIVNEGLPRYVVSKIEEKYNLAEMKVGILGAAFKGESDDIRSSLSYKLKKILEFKSKNVLMTDPYVSIDANLVSLEQTLSQCDILIIGAPHKVYKEVITSKPIIDIWNLLGNGNQI
jgi:UDP-N-acetyl-D-mannosaminuronic acid dehydrogenase